MDLNNRYCSRPYGLLAELTHRCPLHCPYCSNPVRSLGGAELETEVWKRVIGEAAALGVLQIGFSGGEPLLRKDLETLVQVAREAGLYTNLITSGLGLNERRAKRLAEAGLDNVQISFQEVEPELADWIAGVRNGHQQKLRAVEVIKKAGLVISLNVVLHRLNIGRLEQIISFGQSLGASRFELANAQYYGWAYRNRAFLMPTRAQVEAAAQVVQKARQQLKSTLELVYVLPDYYTGRPKPCMSGWARRYLTVSPDGSVLPRPTAWEIPNLSFDTVRERSLGWIWESSESFNRFRGTEWMPQPCRSCPQREIDFGGCRCQAALLTGNASNTDPACEFSPHHSSVQKAAEQALRQDTTQELRFRENP